MHRWLVAGVVALGLLAGVGWAIGARVLEARRTERGERRLVVVAPVASSLQLHRAGATLTDATAVVFDGSGAWLEEGDYFLSASIGGETYFYPVSPRASRPGPDEAGIFHVTVRPPAFGSPPRLDEQAPPFRLVAAGPFEMGDRTTPQGPHYVYVTTFFLGAFEVTNREFRQFLRAPDGYERRENWTEAGWQWRANGTSRVTARLTPSDAEYERFGRDDLPVVLVTWFEANAYCRWLTRTLSDGRWLYRMPTEAEWEKAARGPDAFDYGLTRTLSEAEAPLYNWRKNPHVPVTLVGYDESRGAFMPNRYGLFHMSGNAAEWTQSIHRHYSQRQPYADDDRNRDDATGLRATRGGSWYSATTSRLLTSYGEELQPEMSSDDLGFRVTALPTGGSRP